MNNFIDNDTSYFFWFSFLATLTNKPIRVIIEIIIIKWRGGFFDTSIRPNNYTMRFLFSLGSSSNLDKLTLWVVNHARLFLHSRIA